jgi:hypothetical protein
MNYPKPEDIIEPILHLENYQEEEEYEEEPPGLYLFTINFICPNEMYSNIKWDYQNNWKPQRPLITNEFDTYRYDSSFEQDSPKIRQFGFEDTIDGSKILEHLKEKYRLINFEMTVKYHPEARFHGGYY